MGYVRRLVLTFKTTRPSRLVLLRLHQLPIDESLTADKVSFRLLATEAFVRRSLEFKWPTECQEG